METEFSERLSWVELMLSWGFDNSYTEQISAQYQFYEKHIKYHNDPEKSAHMSVDTSADVLAIIS